MLASRIEEQLKEVMTCAAVDLADGQGGVGGPVQLVRGFVGVDRLDPGLSKVLGPTPIDGAEFRRGHKARQDIEPGSTQQRFPAQLCRRASAVQCLDQLVPIHGASLAQAAGLCGAAHA